MKSSVFPLLRLMSDGDFHSGQAMAVRLGLSRGAVWYQVRHVEALGLKVFKVRGRGYRLSRPLDLLDAARLADALGKSAPTLSLNVMDECDSTNAELHRRQDAPHGSALACEHQRAGRGRRGNAWHSGVGSSLTFSLKWRFSQGAAGLSGLSLAVSVAVVEALEGLGYRGIHLKWPNDLLHDGKKLGGILVEVSGDMQGPGTAIIGIGLNTDLPVHVKEQIDQPVTDLAALPEAARAAGHSRPAAADRAEPRDRTSILATVLASLHAALARYEREGFAPFRRAWSDHDAHRGRSVSIRIGDREIASGRAEGIAEDGALILRTTEGLRSFHSGEVSLR